MRMRIIKKNLTLQLFNCWLHIKKICSDDVSYPQLFGLHDLQVKTKSNALIKLDHQIKSSKVCKCFLSPNKKEAVYIVPCSYFPPAPPKNIYIYIYIYLALIFFLQNFH